MPVLLCTARPAVTFNLSPGPIRPGEAILAREAGGLCKILPLNFLESRRAESTVAARFAAWGLTREAVERAALEDLLGAIRREDEVRPQGP